VWLDGLGQLKYTVTSAAIETAILVIINIYIIHYEHKRYSFKHVVSRHIFEYHTLYAISTNSGGVPVVFNNLAFRLFNCICIEYSLIISFFIESVFVIVTCMGHA
jgi:hypothetical protein